MTIDLRGGGAPSVCDVLFHGGKVGEQSNASRNQRAFVESDQSMLCIVSKVSFRHRGIGLSFPTQEACDVAPVFAEQGPAIVFGVALEEHERASRPLHKTINPGLRRAR